MCVIQTILIYVANEGKQASRRAVAIKGDKSKSKLKCNYHVFLYTGTPKNYDNRQESIMLICVHSNNHDDYEFGYACIGIFDYQIIGY